MKRAIRNLLGGASLAALAVVGAGTANATPIPLLGGYTGPIQIIFNDFENFTGSGGLAVGNSNYGLLQVTSVLDGSNNILYQAPLTPTASNPLIVGLFSGITVGSVTATSAEANTAGVFSFYYDTTQTFGAIAAQGLSGYTTGGCSAVNTQCYNGITNMGYENLLNFVLAQGASSTDTNSYLHAVIDSFDPLVGTAQGYGTITGGTDAGQFGTNGFTTANGGPADLFFKDSFCASGSTLPGSLTPCTTAPTGWSLVSHDPVTTQVVPEPGTLSLLGAGLLGLGMVASWRRKRRNS